MAEEPNINSQLINNYLQQQLDITDVDSLIVPVYPTGEILDEFKDAVRAFVEIDTTIKKLQSLLKERNVIKKTLSKSILSFMSTYDIDDLNTAHGKIRYKLKTSKVGLTKKQIKDKLAESVGDNISDEYIESVFNTRVDKTRQVLQRLKIPNLA